MHTSHYRTKVSEITILDNYVIQTTLKEGEILELEEAIQIIDICRNISRNNKHHSMMVPGENSNISGEARNYIIENVEWAVSLALVSNSLAHKVLFNFSMKSLKETTPYKRHTTTWQALKWFKEI